MNNDSFPVGDQMDQKTGQYQYDGDRVRYDYTYSQRCSACWKKNYIDMFIKLNFSLINYQYYITLSELCARKMQKAPWISLIKKKQNESKKPPFLPRNKWSRKPPHNEDKARCGSCDLHKNIIFLENWDLHNNIVFLEYMTDYQTNSQVWKIPHFKTTTDQPIDQLNY